MQGLTEKDFEVAIEKSLIENGGFVKGLPENFDRAWALDTKTLLHFVQTTQPKEWQRHCQNYPKNPEQAFIERFNKVVGESSLLDILRKGFKDRGVLFRVCFFKPESGLNPDTVRLYQQNILHCTRQLRYSLNNPNNSIDIVLLLNGIPVVSMELKNQFTGQNVVNAVEQYKFDRASKDKIFDFKQRVLVHFAVDLFDVYMTTKLNGAKTYFLPFNQGSNGAGCVGGKGNPVNENGGFVTAYLWEKVLCRDSLMEILHKFIHLQKKDGKETLIFPRFHQLDVVRKLIADVKQNGSGKHYLIQHSAGSGKSNSIAWLAHRLQGLHNENNQVVFNSVIVVTDRRVLDSQLQDTIYQFDHVAGVVRPIKNGSKELKEALQNGDKIIITTLQKFPVIYEDVKSSGKRYAVIVDEAHSSQTGSAAVKLKVALSDKEEILAEYAAAENKYENEQQDYEDKLVAELATHGKHANLSFFAFTATPKAKTLELFGEKVGEKQFQAFHIYSMKQAIEEGFILDVLKNYTTYQQYYKIAKKIDDDPEIDKIKGAKAVRNFASLHPHSIAQKVAIMIEHFNEITKHKIGGNAKAMLVTASRLHAVKYYFAFNKYIEHNKLNDLKALIAFSGSLNVDGIEQTEEKINKIKEQALKNEFHDNFNVLIVAEKYQTGFDEPLLHTMFVDKKLSGVKAVQTLSRLNRTANGKDDTFVLDFVNTQEEIKNSFEPYYQDTVLEGEMDINLIYTLKEQLDHFQIYNNKEIENYAKKYYQNKNASLNELANILKPTADKYNALNNDKKDEFKKLLTQFNRAYAFIIQICRIFDKDLHKFSIFAKYLSTILPKDNSQKINLNDKLALEYYKVQKQSDGSIKLEGENNTLEPKIGGSGDREEKQDLLTEIIKNFNEKFGTNFSEQDKVLAQLKADISQNKQIISSAQEGDKTKFNALWEKLFANILLKRRQENSEFFDSIVSSDEQFQHISKSLANLIYQEQQNMNLL